MPRCTRCGGKITDGRRRRHEECTPPAGREPLGSARRIVVSLSMTPEDVARLDELRGDETRSGYVRRLLQERS